jgi:hypothetical protein
VVDFFGSIYLFSCVIERRMGRGMHETELEEGKRGRRRRRKGKQDATTTAPHHKKEGTGSMLEWRKIQGKE